MLSNYFSFILIGIGVLGFIMLFAAYYQQYCPNWLNLTEYTQSWLNNGLLNMGSGLIGSILVITLYDRVQEVIREKEQKRRQLVALRELGSILKNHNAFFMSIYAATGDMLPKTEYKSAESALLEERYITNVKYLDIYKPSSQSSLKNTPWYSWLHDSCSMFVLSLREIQNRYYSDLDTEIIELISTIINDGFIMIVVHLPEMVKFNNSYLKTIGFPTFHTILNDEIVREHVNLVASLIKCHNELVGEHQKVTYYDSYWHLEGFPIGFGRVDNSIFNPMI